ncbi:MAG: hypothetical protein K2J85_05315 [Anaeroplasmataceae bacterium]|nr:hypothetical protein [Anaeroplasmataceae bacterium]
MLNKNDLKKYYTSIKKNLSCSFNMKSVFIKELNDRVSDFLEDNPNSTIENIIENFGTPEEITKGFDKDSEYYKRKARNRLIIEIALLVLLIAVITISSIVICNILNDLGGDIIITTE